MIELAAIQDLALTLALVLASLVVIPIIRNKKSKVPRRTSGLYTPIGYITSFTYFTMNLYLSSFAWFTVSSMWFFVFLYRPVARGGSNE